MSEELRLAAASGLPRPHGIALRAHALLATGETGIEALEASIALLERTPARLELARSLVELGAALRRSGRRADAREPLAAGRELAYACGADRLVARAGDELRAAGARPRRIARTGVDALTASELRAARLVAQGRSNAEVAQELFVSLKTVETHLSSAYAKLGARRPRRPAARRRGARRRLKTSGSSPEAGSGGALGGSARHPRSTEGGRCRSPPRCPRCCSRACSSSQRSRSCSTAQGRARRSPSSACPRAPPRPAPSRCRCSSSPSRSRSSRRRPRVAGAVAALATLLVFTAAIAVTLARGAAPDCNCFGGLGRTAVGRGTLVRNALLAAIAAFAAAAGTEGAIAWIRDAVADDRGWVIAIVALAALVLGLAWFCWQLLRQNGRLLLRLDAQTSELGAGETYAPGLAVGEIAPAFARESLDGRPISSRRCSRRAGPSHWSSPIRTAAPAAAARARRARPARGRADGRDRRAGNAERLAERARELGLERVVHDADAALFGAYRFGGSPAAVVTAPTGAWPAHPSWARPR